MKRILFYGLILLVLVITLMATIRVEVFRYNSPDLQYSVIIKGSLLKRLLPSLPKMPGDGTSFENGKVIVWDNKEQKLLYKNNFYVKGGADWKKDTVIIRYLGFYYSIKLPRPIMIKK